MTKRLAAALLIACGAIASPAFATEHSTDTTAAIADVDASVPERFRIDVANAQLLGMMLQQEDRAAWVASDALVASNAIARLHGTQSGWLTRTPDPDGKTWMVSFTARDGAREFSFADVSVDLHETQPRVHVEEIPGGRELDSDERALAMARDAVLKRDDWLSCSRTYNYSLGFREGPKGKEVVVKLLPARTDPKVFPLGGFHEYRIPAYEGQIIHYAQTRSCIDAPPMPDNGVGFMVTHLTSETPTQFHVFMSLSYGKPLFVGTTQNNLTWKVDAGRITVVDAIPESPETPSKP
jgi:hypothetical protein